MGYGTRALWDIWNWSIVYRIRGYFQVVNVIAKKFRKQWITGISIHVCVWSHELTKRTILSYQKGQGKTYIYTLIRPLTSKHWHVLGDHKIYLLKTCIVLLFRLWYRSKCHESEVIDALILMMMTFVLCKAIGQALTQNITVTQVSILCNSARLVVMHIKMRTCIILLWRLKYYCKCHKVEVIYNRCFGFDNSNIFVKWEISWTADTLKPPI